MDEKANYPNEDTIITKFKKLDGWWNWLVAIFRSYFENLDTI